MTECTQRELRFRGPGRREVVARFDGGDITSDAGVMLLGEVERQTGILQRFAECFRDHRRPERIEHSVGELVSQRVLGLCLGYEDLNDHDELRLDPLLAAVVGKRDPKGARRRGRDQGAGLAGSRTLNRLELGTPDAAQSDRYKRISLDTELVDELLVDVFLASYSAPPKEIVLDLDATDDPLHGAQEGRFFHGYYDCYCYLPLYVFCGGHLLCARLRRSNRDGAAGSVEELQRIVSRIREAWPKTRILVRGDSGFCRDWLMSWCEEQGLDYVFGVARNPRLEERLAPFLSHAEDFHRITGEKATLFTSFDWSTRETWSRTRCVIGKAEWTRGGGNPRFIVTTLTCRSPENARRIYREVYCARGDMENRIKEQQLDLFADRTSTHTMRGNQLRLYMSSIAYVLMHALRRLGLEGTEMAQAQCGTIRLRLLKIGARVSVTARKIWVHMAEACPWAGVFLAAWRRLCVP
jgi:hypothetical protein